MYNSQEIAMRIKSRVKVHGTTVRTMLTELELGINTISHLANGQEISYLNLAKIAEYLDCSVDYLLGRTDNPNLASEVYIYGDNNGVQAVKNGSVTVHQPATDKFNAQILELLDSLTLEQKAEAILMISKIKGDS